jgi:aminoglycoside 3-N-acetyltransferase
VKSSGNSGNSSPEPHLSSDLKATTYIPYRQIAAEMNLAKGSVVWLTADLTKLTFMARRKEGEFSVRQLIDSFLEQIGPDGTLLIPSFNFNLQPGDHYSSSRTLPVTGALATEALRSGGFQRTRHPLHSFLVAGKRSQELLSLKNVSSFGSYSPFHFLHIYQGKVAILGTSIAESFSFVHYVEEKNKVRYRKYKNINIRNDDLSLREDYLFFAKKTGWTMDMAGLEKLLKNGGAVNDGRINDIPYAVVDLAAAFPIIETDILTNRARNIARFSLKLYLRDHLKRLLSVTGIHTPSEKISHDPGIL